MKVPVLLILFNRLNTTQQVFSSIRDYKPEKLFIAADGPRKDRDGEAEKCASVRDCVLSGIDWKCDVKTLFHTENLGCGRGPEAAISWFFDHVDEGIILEDDCVAHPDFFPFTEQLLEYYRDDDRISIISGCNFDVTKRFLSEASYFFSVFPYTWGWATWKRNWAGYDYTLSEWNKLNRKKYLSFIFKEKKYNLAWKNLFDNMSKNIPKDIWDYQFFFQCYKKKQLSIVPSVNMISNIGTGEEATHTVFHNNPKMSLKLESMTFPLKHPDEYKRNYIYDSFLQELNYGVVEQVSLFKKLKRFVKKHIRSYSK